MNNKIQITNKPMYREFLEKWINKLKITNVPIEILADKFVNYAIPMKNGFVNASSSYNPITKRFRLVLSNDVSNYICLHELGHIKYDTTTNRTEFNPEKENVFTKKQIPFFIIVMSLLDSLSDYRVSITDTEALEIVKNHDSFQVSKNDKIKILSQYIFLYLRKKFAKSKVIFNLDLKNVMNFTNEDFEYFNQMLDQFNTIKDENNFKKVLAWIYGVLKACKKWNDIDIKEFLNLMFKF